MRCTSRLLLIPLLTLALAREDLRADVELPAVFGDRMVLQSGTQTKVWGRAEPGEKVTVTVAECTETTTTGQDGAWMVQLEKLVPGGPHRMEVRGKNTVVFEDVLVGEVWIGSGQSNMVVVSRFCPGFADNVEETDLPRVRIFHEASGPKPTSQWKGQGQWLISTPKTAAEFSAVLFYFGLTIHKELDVPVGLIESSMSGTPIQSWTSAEAQFADPVAGELLRAEDRAYRALDVKRMHAQFVERLAQWEKDVEQARAEGLPNPKRPRNLAESALRQGGSGGLFNGKIAPLIPYGIRGVLWYQGEQNVRPVWFRGKTEEPHASLYRHQLPLLVKDWRTRWGLGDFPFAWVQLPNFADGRKDASWQLVREAQRRALTVVPNSGMAVSIDVGEADDIHPRNKRPVGERLAAWALGTVYGKQDVVISGPMYASHEIIGREVIIHFDHTDGHLVRVEGAGVKTPVAVRYGWKANPPCNLFNGVGFPASPFTTVAEPWGTLR